MITANNRPLLIVATVFFILLIPLIAMQFTQEVNWSITDFMIGAILLFGFGFLIEMVLRIVKKTKERIILCVALLLILLVIWAELAVGLLGSQFSGD